ncbi:MAG: hypothetical protein V2I33_12375 [Kangiellaceae bacterium]|jgi:hypothetical protein|nr:hypothetical protein [Kangiellaceae bacterium]
MLKRRQIGHLAYQLAWHSITELSDITTFLQQSRLSENSNQVERLKYASILCRSIHQRRLVNTVNDIQALEIRVQSEDIKTRRVFFDKNGEGYYEVKVKGVSTSCELHEGVLDYLRFMHKGEMSYRSLLMTIKDYLVLIGHIKWFDLLCEESYSLFYNENIDYMQKPWTQKISEYNGDDLEQLERVMDKEFKDDERNRDNNVENDKS